MNASIPTAYWFHASWLDRRGRLLRDLFGRSEFAWAERVEPGKGPGLD